MDDIPRDAPSGIVSNETHTLITSEESGFPAHTQAALTRWWRIVAIRVRQVGLLWRRQFRRQTAWVLASATGTLGLVLMLVMQLLYVLPSTAAVDPAPPESPHGPQTARDLLPLVTSTAIPAAAAPVVPVQPTPGQPTSVPSTPTPAVPGANYDYEPVLQRQPEPPPQLDYEPVQTRPREAEPTPLGSDPLDQLFFPTETKPDRPQPLEPAVNPLLEPEPPLPEPESPLPEPEPPPVEPPPEPPLADFPFGPPIDPMERSETPATPVPMAPMERTPPQVEERPPLDFDPLDNLFPGLPSAREPDPPQPLPLQPTPTPPENTVPPLDVSVLVLPTDDAERFEAVSHGHLSDRLPRPQPLGVDRWDRAVGESLLPLPRPYRERLTAADIDRLERESGSLPTSSDLPDRQPDAKDLDVTVEKVGAEQMTTHAPTRYRIVVQNRGQHTVDCVDVDDTVPPTHRVLDVDPPALWDDGTLRWRLRDVAPGERRELSVLLMPTVPGRIETTATARTTATVSAATEVMNLSLKLQVDLPERVRVGGICEITFIITNDGDNVVEDVRLRDILPAGLTHRLGERLEYVVGSLPPGGKKEALLTAVAERVGPASNEAVLLVAGEERQRVASEIAVYEPSFRLRREGWREISIGRSVTFTNHVQNITARELNDIEIEETVPPGLEVVRVGSRGRYDRETGTIHWVLDRLAPQETIKLDVTLRPRSPGEYRTLVYGTTDEESAMPIAAHVQARSF